MKTNRKQLKVDLALGIKKHDPLSLALKLGKLTLFNGFLDLADFWDLHIFWPFDFPNFLAISTPPTPSPLSPLTTFTEINLCDGAAVFNIEMSRAAILQKP